MEQVLQQFCLDGTPVSCEPFGNGHINRTFRVTCSSGRVYTLQRINRVAFRHPEELIENIDAVSRFIAKKNTGLEMIRLCTARGGRKYAVDAQGEFWRAYDYISGGLSLEAPRNCNDFYQAAVAFGKFQQALADFPAATLHETIPRFHDTENRLCQLRASVEADACGRVREAGPELAFISAREQELGTLCRMLRSGALPLRDALRFDGVYMEPVIYVNGAKAGEWKYGYNTFEIDITDYLVNGANEIRVQVMHRSPNSRWYSGAGIFRNIWFKTMPDTHFVSDGIYIRTERTDTGYMLKASSEISGSEFDAVAYTVFDMNGTAVVSKTTDAAADTVEIEVESPDEWDIDNPVCYVLRAELLCNGQAVDCINTRFGFRTIEFNSDSGFYLNGRHVKLNGVCMHHDLGALGAAVNKAALYRQLKMMKDMGANAIRTSHNMPVRRTS